VLAERVSDLILHGALARTDHPAIATKLSRGEHA
jgi:hypothetical protein